MTIAIHVLYGLGGVCELGAVAATAWDIRSKIAHAERLKSPGPPPYGMKGLIAEQQAAAHGGATTHQVRGVLAGTAAALDVRALRWAALLLSLGILFGTAGNFFSASR
jgi:hypothetical protein